MKRLSQGQQINQYTLDSIQGTQVRIPHNIEVTHLQFRRFAGCPICNLHLQSFVQRYDELRKHNIQEVTVFYSTVEELQKHQANIPFPMIADPEKKLYADFGVDSSLMSVMHPGAWSASVKGVLNFGVSLPAQGESPLGLPADFLIDTQGKIMALKYGSHAYDQWEVDQVIQAAQDHTPGN